MRSNHYTTRRFHVWLILLLLSTALGVAGQSSGVAHAAVVRFPPLSKLDCSQESSLQSINSLTSTYVDFLNQSPIPVKVYWLDFSGHRVLYNTLSPGQSWFQLTYVTHPWVIPFCSRI